MSDLNDDDILKGIEKGNSRIIADFYHKNLPIITNYIRKNSGSETDAEDIFHDALVITYQKVRRGELKLDCSLSTYVFAVSRNLWMNALRKRKKIRPENELLNISESTEKSIIETINTKDKQLLYQKYFTQLGASCQQLLLHFFNGKSMADISILMGYSEGYSRKKKFECKKKLLQMIEVDPLYKELNTQGQENNDPLKNLKS